MIEPDSNQIIKNYYKGTIDIFTAFNLLTFIKQHPEFRSILESKLIDSLGSLEKIEMSDEDYFNLSYIFRIFTSEQY